MGVISRLKPDSRQDIGNHFDGWIEVIPSLGLGGIQNHLSWRANADLGSLRGIIALTETGNYRVDLPDTLPVFTLQGRGVRGFFSFIRTVRRLDSRVLVSHAPRATIWIYLSSLFGFHSSEYIVVAHRISYGFARGGFPGMRRALSLILRLANAKAYHVLAVSNAAADGHIAEGASSVSVVPLGALPPLSVSEAEPTGAFTFLVVGRSTPEKNYSGLWDAVQILAYSTDQDFILQILGYGADVEAVSHRAFPSHVHVSVKADAREAWGTSDVLVIPSLEEGGPLTLFEAQLCGLPVIATDTGLAREYLTGDAASEVVPVGDARALAKAMLRQLRQGRMLPTERKLRAASATELVGLSQVERFTAHLSRLADQAVSGTPKRS